MTGKIEFTDKKQFQGVKRYLIDKEMSGDEIVKVLDEFPKAFFALSFKTVDGSTEIKIKPKASVVAQIELVQKDRKPGFGSFKRFNTLENKGIRPGFITCFGQDRMK